MRYSYTLSDRKHNLTFELTGLYLSILGGDKKKLSPNALKVLEVLLGIGKHPGGNIYTYNEIAHRAGLDSGNQDLSPTGTQRAIYTLRNAFVELYASRGVEIDSKNFMVENPGKNPRRLKLRLLSKAIPMPDIDEFTDDESSAAQSRAALENKAGGDLNSILGDLISAFPDSESLFARTYLDGTRLPVLIFDTLVTPNFPIPISGLQKKLEVERASDSLFQQRLKQGSKMYPGAIYTLDGVQGRDWRLGWTVYTDLIESCDYIAARIKEHWQHSKENGQTRAERRTRLGSQNREDPLSTVGRQWNERVKQIRQGNWSSYTAGIAFSIPTFQIHDNGSISLLCAEGSQLKQAGAGQKHVCPAGMLEFFEPDPGDSLSLDALRGGMAKELLEETVFGAKFQVPSDSAFALQIQKFSTEVPGKMTEPLENLRSALEKMIVPNWDNIWSDIEDWQREVAAGNKPHAPDLAPLRAVLGFDPDLHPSFVVLDALCFRPELIVPIYQTSDLSAILNWEYQERYETEESFERVTWEDEEHLEEWVLRHSSDWCAPGLAAAYLGAQHYFQNKESCLARACAVS